MAARSPAGAAAATCQKAGAAPGFDEQEEGKLMAHLSKKIMVCSSCLCARCWHGEFMCQTARTAGTKIMTEAKLGRLGREHHSNWSDQKLLDVYGSPDPFGYA